MAVSWQLEWRRPDGQYVKKSFADWGIKDVQIRYASQDADVLSFTYVGRWEDAQTLFGYGDVVRVWRDGTQWFVGVIVSLPIAAAAASEEMAFEAKGPWIFLEEHEFQRPWLSWNSLVPLQIDCTHIIYNAAAGGALASTRTQIKVMLDYLLALYPAASKPFQYKIEDILNP